MTYDILLSRLGFFRNRASLSARATSHQLGYSELFFTRIENGSIELKVRTLLEFFDIVGITPQDFFYLGKDFSPESKSLLELFSNLSKEKQSTVIDLMKKLQ